MSKPKKQFEFDPETQSAINAIGKSIDWEKHGCAAPEELNDKDWNAIKIANQMSDGRTRFGLRKDSSRGTLMGWSNGAQRWFPSGIMTGDENRKIDANEMIVPISAERVKRISCYVKDLPLYYASVEAKLRGQISPKDALDIFLEGKGITDLLDTLPSDARESMRKEIEEKGWEWYFSIGGKKE